MNGFFNIKSLELQLSANQHWTFVWIDCFSSKIPLIKHQKHVFNDNPMNFRSIKHDSLTI